MDARLLTTAPGADEAALVGRLRARDEAAFADLVGRYHGALTRLALTFVPSRWRRRSCRRPGSA
jgi:hypothetical protein